MCLNKDSKYYDAYNEHVSNINKTTGVLGGIYDIISNMPSNNGIYCDWCDMDTDTQDRIIDDWCKILK